MEIAATTADGTGTETLGDDAPAGTEAAGQHAARDAVPARLPSARQIVSRGLVLAASGSRELRSASLYFGLILAGLAGPLVAYLLVSLVRGGVGALEPGLGAGSDTGVASWLGLIAAGGAVVLGIEGSAVAVAILGAREAGRSVSLRDALIRSRQVFWRLFGVWIVLTVVGLFATWLVRQVIPGVAEPGDLASTLIATISGAPFCYAQAGLVLGNVGMIETLRRSLILARARPSFALAITAFAILAAAVEAFALLAGADVVVRIVDGLQLGLDGPAGLVLLVVAGLIAVVALGSLVFTMTALQAAPQVVAFLALTGYSAGLDRVSDVPPGVRFRWVTRPMLTAVVLAIVSAAAAASSTG